MDASKINFLGFKYYKLPIRTSLLPVAFWGKKKFQRKVVSVCQPPLRRYFFTSLPGATLWGILTPAPATTPDTFDFLILQWCIFRKKYMVAYMLSGGTLRKYNWPITRIQLAILLTNELLCIFFSACIIFWMYILCISFLQTNFFRLRKLVFHS